MKRLVLMISALFFCIPCMAETGFFNEDISSDEGLAGDEGGGDIESKSVGPIQDDSGLAGNVYYLTGVASVSSEDKKGSKEELHKYSEIASGAVIETESESSIIIQLPQGNGYLFADQRTRFQINYSPNDMRSASEKNYAVMVVLWSGRIRAYSPELNLWSSYTIITPNASIGVPGGDLEVRYSEDKGITAVLSFKEFAVVKYLPEYGSPAGKSVLLKEEKKAAVVSSRKEVSNPESFEMAEADKTFWSSKKISIDVAYKAKEDKQALLMQRQVRRIEAGAGLLTPLDLVR